MTSRPVEGTARATAGGRVDRLAVGLRWALLGSGVAVAFLLFLGRVVDWMPRESVYALLLLAGLVVGWVAAVARLLVSVFGQSSALFDHDHGRPNHVEEA